MRSLLLAAISGGCVFGDTFGYVKVQSGCAAPVLIDVEIAPDEVIGTYAPGDKIVDWLRSAHFDGMVPVGNGERRTIAAREFRDEAIERRVESVVLSVMDVEEQRPFPLLLELPIWEGEDNGAPGYESELLELAGDLCP